MSRATSVYPPPPPFERKVARCDFCGRSAKKARRLVAVPRGHVCDVCVTACAELIVEADQHLVAAAQPRVLESNLDAECSVCDTIVRPDECVTIANRGGPVCLVCVERLVEIWGALGGGSFAQ